MGALALNTDGIDVWGSDVHVHDVEITNADDCVCVKGANDGSRIWSENWMIENSKASGGGLTLTLTLTLKLTLTLILTSKARGEGLSVGTVWSGHFITRNVTFQNIEMMHTRKGIYVKIDTNMNSAEVRSSLQES